MTFPVYLPFFGYQIHPHPVLEGLGYACGTRVYFWKRRKQARTEPFEQTAWILLGCVVGALVGSKLLAWVESPSLYWDRRADPSVFIGGKTIVGGLLGGWIGIEIAKHVQKIRTSMGDLFVWPLAIGTAIGRIGCFLTGLSDLTYGTATTLPWGVDFGDGIHRHPTQLYESVFVLLLAGALSGGRRPTDANGLFFRRYLCGYMLFRFFVEFIKPRELTWMGLSPIQIAALLGAVFTAYSAFRLRASPPPAHV